MKNNMAINDHWDQSKLKEKRTANEPPQAVKNLIDWSQQ